MSRAERLAALHAALGEGGTPISPGSVSPASIPPSSGGPRALLRFGAAALDDALPAGGLVAGSHEVCAGGADLPHEAAMVQITAYLLRRGPGPVVWALPRLTLFPPALAEAGLCPSRVLFAEGGREEDVLAVAEEALRHGGLGGVVCEASRLSLTASRRLQLAGEAGGTACLVLRRWRRGAPPAAGTACATRWSVTARPSAAASGLPMPSFRLALTRCRGGRPSAWDAAFETPDERTEQGLQRGDEPAAGTALRLRVAPALADRAAGADAGGAAA